ELPLARPGHLMPAAEKGADGAVPMALHPAPRLRHRTVAEVVGPSPHCAVQRARDLQPRRLVVGPQSSTNLVPNRGHGFLRGARTVIASPVRGECMGPKEYPRKSKDSHRALHTRVLVSFSASPMLVIHRRVVSSTSPAPCRQRTMKSSAYVTSTAPYRRSKPYCET